MDAWRFDDWARRLAGRVTRRAALRGRGLHGGNASFLARQPGLREQVIAAEAWSPHGAVPVIAAQEESVHSVRISVAVARS